MVILLTLIGRLLRITFLQISEVLVIDRIQGRVVETITREIVVNQMLSFLDGLICIIGLNRESNSVSLCIKNSDRVYISLRSWRSHYGLRRRVRLLFYWNWWLLILFIIILVTCNFEIHHELFGMIQERFIIVHLLLVYLDLPSVVVISDWGVYRSVTT